MERYRNLGGGSGVSAYSIGPDSILVLFNDGWKYEYTTQSAGALAIRTMHRLAAQGRGLNSYITSSVRKGYSKKFR